MLNTITKIIKSASFQTEEVLKDQHSVTLIKGSIREAESDLLIAKKTLAGLIMRKRTEDKARDVVKSKLSDLEERAQAVLSSNETNLIDDVATAIANLENELKVRNETCDQLDTKIAQLRHSIEMAHTRLANLKQGAIAAESVTEERKAQKRLNRSIGTNTSMRDAEELIERVMNQSDPFEQSQILDEIDAELHVQTLSERLAEKGYGPSVKVSKNDVLKRLSKNQPQS